MPVDPMQADPMHPVEAASEARRTSRAQRLWPLVFVVFCFELGVFLIVFPWLDYWNNNSLASLSPWLREMWDNAYFRGALSGLGFVNVYISLAEVFRLRRPPADKMVSTL